MLDFEPAKWCNALFECHSPHRALQLISCSPDPKEAQMCRTLPDASTWQRSGVVKLPNDRMLETFTHRGFGATVQETRGISFGLDALLSGKGTLRDVPSYPKLAEVSALPL